MGVLPASTEENANIVGKLITQGHGRNVAALIEETAALASMRIGASGRTPGEHAAGLYAEGRRAVEQAIANTSDDIVIVGSRPGHGRGQPFRRRRPGAERSDAEPGR